MRNLEDLSGPWVGFWVQDRERGAMRLKLHFGNGFVEGGGTDVEGPFTIEGRIEGTSVLFLKRYPWTLVDYVGIWDGDMIQGQWSIGSEVKEHRLNGEFEIWPEKDDQAIERMEAALVATA